MDKLRYILFIVSLSVMTGHDLFPHCDVFEHVDGLENGMTQNVPESPLSQVGDLFSSMQHARGQNSLEYVVEAGELASVEAGASTPLFGLEIFADNGFIGYANRKKQRFRDPVLFKPGYVSHFFSLRGPPSVFS
ncbi:hypothetical protein [Fulvitalea axinellae]|uniref:hypothetical protein n=1 Tax=Fulvitalea axinellae TaxID=1182444 RepID=UPI0030CA2A24